MLPRAAAESVQGRAAAALLPEEAAWAHAAAGLQPEAASAPWVQRAAAGAEEVPDGSRAAGPAEAVASGVTAQQPAEVRRADAAVQPRAAARPDVRGRRAEVRLAAVEPPDVLRAAVPLALPSEPASVFRQGPILAGPARPRAAARFAHAMRSLRIASRLEPSWRAARNEGWSCGSTSPEGSLTKSWFDGVSFDEVLE